MENNSTEVVHRQKKPFLGILNRRSTKIEPQNVSSDDSMLLGNHTNTSDEEQEAGCGAHRPGIFNNKKILERNNTFPSLNTPTKCSSQYNNINNITDSETNSINRHSYYVDDRKALDSLCESENAPNIDIDSDGESRTPSAIRRPLEVTVKLDKPTYNLPSYESYPSPILLSCRSRFRDKFIPPSDKLETQNENQHYSTPNISTQESTLERKDSKKSGSYDTIISSADTSTVSANFINDDKASADSLARQALMAAHVLHLIPTEKARQRNFLQGRLATNSLLGNAELEKVLPTREISIFIGSWNMNGQNPPKQLNDFVLPNGVEHVPDLFVIGTQESCSERFEWEVTLQETLGPSHVLFHSTTLGTLHLAVFLRRDLIWYCSEPEDASLSVRPGTAFRTKGAVAISFCLFGTSMLFVTSHLTAHQQKIKERVQDVKRIIQALDLPRNLPVRYKNKDVTQNFDCVYWCGDLNFRLSEPRANLMKWLETTQFPLPPHLPHGFLHTDQLTSVLADGAAFKGFKEAKIHFPPTYKYDVGSQNFDTSNKQRAPAYTDRILYKYKLPPMGFRRASGPMGDVTFGGSAGTPQSPIKCIAYDSVQSITSSDHKPVWALFRNSLRPGVDSIPLAAGLFNRDVYLEGMKRRLDNTNSEPSTVCSIQ